MAATKISNAFRALWAFLTSWGELEGITWSQRLIVIAVMSGSGAAAVQIIRAVGFDRSSVIQCALVGALLGLSFGFSGRAAARYLKSRHSPAEGPS